MAMDFLFWIVLFSLQCLVHHIDLVAGQTTVDSETCPSCTTYTCRRISGIYTVPILTPGTYNPVVEIPASACDINITELATSENYIAVRIKGGDGIINSNWALGQPGLYFGAGVRFSYGRNSESCKGSCIHSQGPTTEGVLVQILYYNQNPGIAYAFTIPNTVIFDPLEGISPASSSPSTSVETLPKVRFAQRHPERAISRRREHSRSRTSRHHSYRRRTSDTRHSSRELDRTDSLREYYPHQEVNFAKLHEVICASRLRIASSGEGNRYRWKISGFSACSHTCGGGFQTTNIVCISLGSRRQVVVTPENCANHRKPRQQTVACNKSPCSAAWESDPWSECSVTCGSGTQTRTVECRQRFSSTLTLKVSADDCGMDNKPAMMQQCDLGLCSRWSVGPWSVCSKDCGEGVRFRRVVCIQQTSNFREDQSSVTSDSECDAAAKPDTEEKCTRADCEAIWFAGPWGQCSVTCGDGYKSRDVRCIIDDGNQDGNRKEISWKGTGSIESAGCLSSLRPDTIQICSRLTCPLEPRYQRTDRYEPSKHGKSIRNKTMIEGQIMPSNRCSDKIKRCSMAVQARLCSYPYYKDVCCRSCQKHALKH
ncbi:hypothetical protein EGW08_005480 [Elysia chlorotica]|uniref:PLAC domain-containing protein n=1 Tax=Elysia chlorotica TaxID=188477 RepID=A0A433TYW8_ELYCH|nr:hypothetical protein EGW08_005480 [Elysia chlorotica]